MCPSNALKKKAVFQVLLNSVAVEKPQRSEQLFQIPAPSTTTHILLLDFEMKSKVC